jgi:hypothetical protein
METKELLLKELMPIKSNIDIVVQNILKPIKDGVMDKHEVLVRGKFLIECIKKSLKEIEITENAVYLGSKIEVAEVSPKYNYSECEKWNEINAKIKPLNDELIRIEELIKIATKKGVAIVDPNTGETIMPVKKESTSSYKVTLGK